MRSYHLSLRDAIADTTDDTARPPLAGHSDTYQDETPEVGWDHEHEPEPDDNEREVASSAWVRGRLRSLK